MRDLVEDTPICFNLKKREVLDPPRNPHLFHFTLPTNDNPSLSTTRHIVLGSGNDIAQQEHDPFFFGRFDSPPHPQKHPSVPEAPAAPRMGVRGTRVRGEIVEVEGGHIVRSTGRKDRHSKVCTAKGPRDRRVRLSAPTAIQFYDVQDRLGYDRPSKAVDWLIKKAKPAIDELAQLPSWKPTATVVASPASAASSAATRETMIDFRQTHVIDPGEGNGLGNFCQRRRRDEIDKRNDCHAASLSFLPSSLDSDTFADTLKSFPIGVPSDHSATTSSSMQFHGYSPDLILKTSSHSQDLRLSLQSFQEQPLLPRPHHSQTNEPSHHHQQILFADEPHRNNKPALDGSLSTSPAASTWLSYHQRVPLWNSAYADGSGGFTYGSLAVAPMQSLIIGQQGQFIQQRGPLQSSNTTSLRAWIDEEETPGS